MPKANATPKATPKQKPAAKPKAKELASYDAKSEARPRGKSRNYAVVDAAPTACPKCDSTDRTAYRKDPTRTLRQAFSDKVVVTVWRKCRCLKCGQWRFDRTKHEEQKT